MISFKDFLLEEPTPLEKAHTAILVGDHASALKHLANHVPGKNRRKDAEVAKLALSLRSKVK